MEKTDQHRERKHIDGDALLRRLALANVLADIDLEREQLWPLNSWMRCAAVACGQQKARASGSGRAFCELMYFR